MESYLELKCVNTGKYWKYKLDSNDMGQFINDKDQFLKETISDLESQTKDQIQILSTEQYSIKYLLKYPYKDEEARLDSVEKENTQSERMTKALTACHKVYPYTNI